MNYTEKKLEVPNYFSSSSDSDQAEIQFQTNESSFTQFHLGSGGSAISSEEIFWPIFELSKTTKPF